MIPNQGKSLIILRTCNELVRRLSKSKDTVFCGRILMWITSVFPLAEKSGRQEILQIDGLNRFLLS
jgi:THO complex subunit 1